MNSLANAFSRLEEINTVSSVDWLSSNCRQGMQQFGCALVPLQIGCRLPHFILQWT